MIVTDLSIHEALREMGVTLEEHEITSDKSLAELGIDSLKYVELLVLVEEKNDVIFNESDLGTDAIRTVGDLAQLIRKAEAEKAS